jgi:hypothetical protein
MKRFSLPCICMVAILFLSGCGKTPQIPQIGLTQEIASSTTPISADYPATPEQKVLT